MTNSCKLRLLASMAALMGLSSAPALAHHSQAMFDMSKCVSIQGIVRKFEYNFPHSWLWVNVANANGTQDVYGFEASAPAQMIEVDKRWSRDIAKKGDAITVQYSPLKDGRTGGALHRLILQDGTSLIAATPACANEADKVGPH